MATLLRRLTHKNHNNAFWFAHSFILLLKTTNYHQPWWGNSINAKEGFIEALSKFSSKRESPATIFCCFPAARIRCYLSNAGKQQEIVAGDSRLLENFDKASMKPSFAFIEFPHHGWCRGGIATMTPEYSGIMSNHSWIIPEKTSAGYVITISSLQTKEQIQRTNSNMPGIAEVHHVMEGTVNTLSILFNVYLLYLIKYHSTFGVKLYQYLLTIDALLDLALSISAFIAKPSLQQSSNKISLQICQVVFTADGYCTMMSNGFFAGRSASFDAFTVMVYLTFLHTNIIWIPVQFVYRYLLLCKKK
ncbi:serpentine type 7TM GPCR chemoreceptor srd domain-containing protein [Ditylenchus destructor]|uniref:Serpentine type 7TM GPCR chemoreceptor srd domain-containing protein n=1 Tax=Ditylenchus destructor TaxID=166010 RepID=A0AAD4MS88_9BILA|nr:serpentine type 7TM GPCR chemoreceptor srd domain-containing protein [Ditylenchus destructor]